MKQKITYLTAETAQGRAAIEEVMAHAYVADVDSVPSRWARVRLADGVPVSFILVDPHRRLAFPQGDLRYAFVSDVATHHDHRRQGHFRGLMQHTFDELRKEKTPLVVTHGDSSLYRRFGFATFTHHCGIFATPKDIEGRWGRRSPEEGHDLLVVEDGEYVRDDLLLVTDVKAATIPECRAALQAATAMARARGKSTILFEHPAAPSYGSRYPIYPSPETSFTILARACGATVRLQGSTPEGAPVPHADWIRALDATTLMRRVLRRNGAQGRARPKGSVSVTTNGDTFTIHSTERGIRVTEGRNRGAPHITWPPSAVAQLAVGYQSAQILTAIHDAPPVDDETAALLDALFPTVWRFSRNESWTYKS
ncbi:MAG: GNAT family N-acetyltransferase [Anaerolineae bacterium]